MAAFEDAADEELAASNARERKQRLLLSQLQELDAANKELEGKVSTGKLTCDSKPMLG